MSKPKPAKLKTKTLSVYNDTNGLIGCALPTTGPNGEHRPPRQFQLLPGNNPEVDREDWELALKNDIFKRYTELRPVKNHIGKLSKKKQLVVGKFDEDQSVAEQELERRLEQERQARQGD